MRRQQERHLRVVPRELHPSSCLRPRLRSPDEIENLQKTRHLRGHQGCGRRVTRGSPEVARQLLVGRAACFADEYARFRIADGTAGDSSTTGSPRPTTT